MTGQSEFDDKERRALFGSHATLYGDGRPGYPPEVFDHLQTLCNLRSGCQLLEIGPGAGQATGPLLDAGAEVHAVEVGDEFQTLLTTRFSNRKFTVSSGEFETIDLVPNSFDLVAAATSFHWIAPDQGLDRVAQVLKPGGWLALWWNHYGDPDRRDLFREAIGPLLELHAPQFTESVTGGAGIGAHPYAIDTDARVGEIDRNGNFEPVHHVQIPWTATQTTSEIQRFLGSLSHWMALDPTTRTTLLAAVGDLVDNKFSGAVDRPFLTAVYAARRV